MLHAYHQSPLPFVIGQPVTGKLVLVLTEMRLQPWNLGFCDATEAESLQWQWISIAERFCDLLTSYWPILVLHGPGDLSDIQTFFLPRLRKYQSVGVSKCCEYSIGSHCFSTNTHLFHLHYHCCFIWTWCQLLTHRGWLGSQCIQKPAISDLSSYLSITCLWTNLFLLNANIIEVSKEYFQEVLRLS